jgi:hypothetical protein
MHRVGSILCGLGCVERDLALRFNVDYRAVASRSAYRDMAIVAMGSIQSRHVRARSAAAV